MEMKSSIFIGLLYGALLAATTTYKAMMTTLFIGRHSPAQRDPIKANFSVELSRQKTLRRRKIYTLARIWGCLPTNGDILLILSCCNSYDNK